MLLARTLGRTLEELGNTMSAAEFGLWQAAYSLEPWGEARTDLGAALVASTVANFAGRQLKPGASADLTDYLFDWAPKDDAPEPDLMSLARQLNGAAQ